MAERGGLGLREEFGREDLRLGTKMAEFHASSVFGDEDGRLSEVWSLKRHNPNRLSDFRLA